MKPASLFSDHMVLQQGLPVPVWGTAKPGQAIRVSIAGRSAKTTAGRNGQWQVKLPPLAAGGPYEMSIESGEKIVLRDIMVGEVWVCSGQSNMQMSVGESKNADEEIAAARHDRVRLFTVPAAATVEPVREMDACWKVCSPETIKPFSAVGYFFGRELQKDLNVPIGLINSSWGGTMVEAWTSREALLSDCVQKNRVADYERNLKNFDRQNAVFQASSSPNVIIHKDPGNQGFELGWAKPETDTSLWGEITAPGYWNLQGLNFNGIIWFRKEIKVPPAWAGKDLCLQLGACDKTDVTYFNNVRVGGLGPENPNAWSTLRKYAVPGALVKAGTNVIVVRIFSWAFAAGFSGPVEEMKIFPANGEKSKPIPLNGAWRYKVEYNMGKIDFPAGAQPLGPGNPHSPYSLFNGMIRPLIPFAVRGAIWYQGESNAGRAYAYRRLFPLLIKDWRKQWQHKELAFHFVQLANYMAPLECAQKSEWAELREAQLHTLALPHTGMAVAIDIGDAIDIHPKNKQEVGKRLALAALANTYRRKLEFSGPIYDSHKIAGGKVRLKFIHAGGGLASKGGKLRGFTIAGSDHFFYPAEAKISGQTVVVSSRSVPRPVAVRYGWADNPPCNLYNKAGLPASSFRTDSWPGATVDKE